MADRSVCGGTAHLSLEINYKTLPERWLEQTHR
jgi:hypothetical protein